MMPEPKYGHGYCPCCLAEIDLSTPHESFSCDLKLLGPTEEVLMFYICDKCANRYKNGGEDIQRGMQDASLDLVKASPKNFYAVVSLSALIVNDFDLVNAFEQGVELPKDIVLQFQVGEINSQELYALAKLYELGGRVVAQHEMP